MNNSISGSLGLIATLFSITAMTAQPQAGLAQETSASLVTNEAKFSPVAPAPVTAVSDFGPDSVKVGEQSIQRVKNLKDETVAKVHTQESAGQQIATLYVRNIPVITFTMPQTSVADETKIGIVKVESYSTRQKTKSGSSDAQDASNSVARSFGASEPQDPTARASAIAAKINQLYRDGVDAKQIAVSWKEGTDAQGQKSGQYLISANRSELVTINPTTLSVGSNRDLGQDALQVTNRLRRLLGDASPVTQIEGMPKVMAAVLSDRKSTRLNSSHSTLSRMPSSA